MRTQRTGLESDSRGRHGWQGVSARLLRFKYAGLGNLYLYRVVAHEAGLAVPAA